MGLRAWDFPTERALPRTPLITRTVDQTEEDQTKKANTSRKRRAGSNSTSKHHAGREARGAEREKNYTRGPFES